MKSKQAPVLWPLIAALAVSQASAAVWPPISKDELAMKDDPANPGAPAVILYREVNSDDVKGFQTHYVRIKILNDEGRKYGDIEIPYLEKSLQVEAVQARTIQSDGKAIDFQGQIVDRTALKARKVKVQVKAFTLPDVQKGSILEYSYTVRFHRKFPDFIKHPSAYVFDRVISIPSTTFTIREDLFTRRMRFVIRQFPEVSLCWTAQNIPGDNRPRSENAETMVLELENVPAFREEEFMLPEREARGWVAFYYLPGRTLARSFWSETGKDMAKMLAPFLGDPKKLKAAVAGIAPASDPPETQLRKLYTRVQQLRYVSDEPAKTEQEVKREGLKENKRVEDILNRGYAYGNEINLAFVALAQAAGFESAPVRLKSRSAGFFLSAHLDPSELDAMVVWVRAGGKDYFLDPATRSCPFDVLPWTETNSIGILLTEAPIPPSISYKDSEYSGLVRTPGPTSASAVVRRSALLQLDPAGGVEGKLTISFIGQEALIRRIGSRNLDEAARKKKLEEEVKEWLPAAAIADLQGAVNWDQHEQALQANFAVKVPDYAAPTARRLLFRGAFFESKASVLKSAARVQPVYFAYPFQETDDVVWKLPPGYRVASLPEKKDTPTIFGKYSASLENSGGTVHAQRHFTVDALLVPVEYYPALRSYFGSVRMSDETQIVLDNTESPNVR